MCTWGMSRWDMPRSAACEPEADSLLVAGMTTDVILITHLKACNMQRKLTPEMQQHKLTHEMHGGPMLRQTHSQGPV